MTAVVLPDIDRTTLEELRDRMPSLKLSEIELPSMEQAGRQADRAIDRLLGRSRPSIWPWIAMGIGIAAIAGTTIALVSWFRRPSWPASATGSYPNSSPSSFGDAGAAYGDSTHSPDAVAVDTFAVVAEDDAASIEGGRA